MKYILLLALICLSSQQSISQQKHFIAHPLEDCSSGINRVINDTATLLDDLAAGALIKVIPDLE